MALHRRRCGPVVDAASGSRLDLRHSPGTRAQAGATYDARMSTPPAPFDDPEFLPYRLDPVLRRALWLRMPREARERAAFLDERAMPASPEGAWAGLASIEAVPVPLQTAHAIFHIGHCGSTLLSRVLEATPAVQSLREPMPLRTLVDAWSTRGTPTARLSAAQADVLLAGTWRALSRPLAPATQVVVKPTSRCIPLAGPLLDAFPDLRAVLLDMPLRPWLATLFKSETSLTDVATAADERLAWLQSQGLATGLALHALDLPAQCALGWLAEQLRFDALATGPHAARVLRLDFEDVLASPAAEIARLRAHFGFDAAAQAAALASPHWQRYSKAPEHAYRADDRAHDLALAASRFGGEVEAGIAAVRVVLDGHEAVAAKVLRRLG